MMATLVQELKKSATDESPGVERVFHENGELALERIHVNGVPNGPFAQYDQDGNVTRQGTYKNGKIVDSHPRIDGEARDLLLSHFWR